MKRTIKQIAAAFGLVAGALSAYGNTNYWDNNGDAAGFGTAGGTWGAEPKWSADSTGASVPAVTETTASDDLYFGTDVNGLAAGTITVDGTGQAFRSMTFGAASGPITLSEGMLTLAAPASEIFVNNASNAIASVLSGTNGLHTYSDLALTYPFFLTADLVTLFTNAVLSDYVQARATMAGGTVATIPATPYYFTNNGTNATMQLQVRDGTWTKCVKIELTQSGPDIAGRAIYAKYSADLLGFNFDTGGSTMTIATSGTASGYGITQLSIATDHVLTLTGVNTYSGGTAIGSGTLNIGGEGQLGSGSYAGAITNSGLFLYNSFSNQSLSGAISGTGSLVKDAPSKSVSPITYTNFLKSTATTIIPHASLSECVGADGLMGGNSINSGNGPVPAHAYFFTNRGATATYQLQTFEGGATKCVKVELTQLGVGIAARALYAKYLLGSSQLGFDFDASTSNVLSIATSYTSAHYGISETTLSLYSSSRLILSGANTYTGGTVVNGGVLEAASTNAALPSSGGITVNNGAELVLNAGTLYSGSAGGVGNLNPITVNGGGTLTLAGEFNAGYSRPVTINGGTLTSTILVAGINDCGNYVNNLTLKNGAQVTGNKLRLGDIGGYPPLITVSGTTASSLAAGINLAKVGTQSMTFNVADVTGTPEPDLLIPGVIQDYPLPHLTGMPIIKTGAGTLSLSGVNTHTGRITIASGTLALRADNTLNAFCSIVLNGGALDMGSFSNSLDTLTLSGKSTLALGSGKLAFADSRGTAWGTNTLTLTGTLGAETLRFGTNSSALTSGQLSAITLDGGSVRIKSDGYLALGLKGTLIRLQ